MIYALEGRAAINDNSPENNIWQEIISMKFYLNYLRELKASPELPFLTGEQVLDAQINAMEDILNET